ncbi:hypothetical protein K2173_010933 [Erythroxylum novogranatense]|uniref:UBA domain-containing protein n=1 Tax=Erythroxylum novogranatense TaxID=1862640 RepID=A0AAV8T025_9ROSI|nr:hypothetical protein K2173_010933 [Erythroxylum novogranatense]
MNGGPYGFNNAPVTKVFVIASCVLTFFFGIRGMSTKLGFSYQDIFRRPQVWKLITSVFAFSSTPELMFGLYLLYYFRVFERQIGSNKYSVFILFSVIGSLLFQFLALALLKDPSATLTSGPYGLIFASFIPFYFDIPVSTRLRVFNINFSDKSFIYLAGLQLLLSSWKRSFLPGLCGILAGSLYRLNLLGIRKAKFPEFVISFLPRFSWPATGSPRGEPERNLVDRAPTYTVGRTEGRTPTATVTMEPPESSIMMLVSMGFDRNSARQALVQARNDINTASNILLEAQSH